MLIVNSDKIQEFVETEESGFKSYKKISNNILNRVVNARVEEIIDLINKDLIFLRSKNVNFNKILSRLASKLMDLRLFLKKNCIAKVFQLKNFNLKLRKIS